MKQFLVLLATLPILLYILMQMTVNQITAYKINEINNCVYEAKDAAQIEGCFTADIESQLKSGLEKLGFSESDIHLQLDSSEINRGGFIHYRVGVDFGAVLLPVLAGENNYTYVIDSYAVSEKYIE